MSEPKKHLDTNLHNPAHAATCDDKREGEKQSVTLSVPNPPTILHMGEWLSDPGAAKQEAKFGFPGISMKTNENFYLKAKENAVFDVGEDATFRSGKGWVQFAQTLDVAIKQKVMIASGHSLVIAAGPTDTYVAPPEAGEQLHPPTFDRGAVHALVLKHLTAKDSFLTTAAQNDLTAIRKKLGQRLPFEPEKQLRGRLLSLFVNLQRARDVRNKLKGVKKIVQAAPHIMEIASIPFKYDQASKDRRQFDLHRAIEPLRETEEASDLLTQGTKELWKKDSETTEHTEKENAKISTLVYGLTTVEREAERVTARAQKLSATWDELTEERDKDSVKSWYDWATKATELMAAFVGTADAFAAEVLNAAAGLAATAALGVDEPRLILAAKADLQLSSGEELGAYAKGGFQLHSDEGPFDLHTKGLLRAHTLESAEIAAKFHLALGAGEAAELASAGPVFIRSSGKGGELEVLGETITFGTLTSENTRRNHNVEDTGDVEKPLASYFDPSTQEPTKHITASANETVLLQAGGEDVAPRDELRKSRPPAGIRLHGDKNNGSAEVWSQGKIVVEADESRGEIRIAVGNFVLLLNKDRASLGLAKAKDAEAAKAFLSINDKGQIALATHKGAWLKLSEEANLKSKNGNSTLDLTGSGVKVNGSKVYIG